MTRASISGPGAEVGRNEAQRSCLPENMAVGPPPTHKNAVSNLRVLCKECHAREHRGANNRLPTEDMYTTEPPPEALSKGYDSCSMAVRALVS